MSRPTDSISELLHRTRRRAWARRAVDYTLPFVWAGALGVVVGMSVGNSKAGLGAALVISIAGGILSLIRSRSTPLDVAVEIDRHYALHELMSTAWLTRDSVEPWAIVIRRQAEAQAAVLAPPPIATRFGGRVVAATLLSLILLSVVGQLSLLSATSAPPYLAQADASSVAPPSPADATRRRLSGPTRRPGSAVSEVRRPTDPTTGNSPRPARGSAPAQGPGRAESDATATVRQSASAASGLGRTTDKTAPATGDGHGDENATASDPSATAAGRVIGRSANKSPATPSNGTPAAPDIGPDRYTENVPPRYHDLVRAFFDR